MSVIKYIITKEVTIQKEKPTYTFIPDYIVDQVQKEKNNFLHLTVKFSNSSRKATLVFSRTDLTKNLIGEGKRMENKNYPAVGKPTFSFFKLQLLPENLFREISSLLSLKRRYLPMIVEGDENYSEDIDSILNLINKQNEPSQS